MNQDNHNVEDLIEIFNDTPSERDYNVILFAKGYYSSALHEISHWLIAGKERHKLEDFGYWYEPDGRSEERQKEFEKFEIKPQAIEWILATAAGFRYFASADNLTGNVGDNSDFKQAVYEQVKQYASQGLSESALMWKKYKLKRLFFILTNHKR